MFFQVGQIQYEISPGTVSKMRLHKVDTPQFLFGRLNLDFIRMVDQWPTRISKKTVGPKVDS